LLANSIRPQAAPEQSNWCTHERAGSDEMSRYAYLRFADAGTEDFLPVSAACVRSCTDGRVEERARYRRIRRTENFTSDKLRSATADQEYQQARERQVEVFGHFFEDGKSEQS
jgi:hypothetical protein